MATLSYLFAQAWAWVADTGINLAIIIMLAFLVPRAGRFADRLISREVRNSQADDDSKASLAFVGVGIYIAQLIAYFLLAIAFLQQLGFSLAGAAIPATVVSAAVGFGAQSIIADFLSGFFILSEKQFGVGDWVRFQGNGIEIEGSIISITMRATTIRTLAQETVTIPNSAARVCINASNYWSSAVAVMNVPLLGSRSPEDAVERTEHAANEALAKPEIAEVLQGQLDIHPATDVIPPSTVGMPWLITIRLMVQTQAGSQFMVERALRMAVLREFWEEYGSATTIDGTVRERLTPATHTELFDAVTPASAAASQVLDDDASRDEATTVLRSLPDEKAAKDPAATDQEKAHSASEQETEPAEAQEPQGSLWKNTTRSFKDMRGSTGWMLGGLGLLLLLKLLFFSVETDAGDRIAGVLAPPAAPSSTSETTTGPTEVYPSPTYIPEPSTEPTPTAEESTGTDPSQLEGTNNGNGEHTEPAPIPGQFGRGDQNQGGTDEAAQQTPEPTATNTPDAGFGGRLN